MAYNVAIFRNFSAIFPQFSRNFPAIFPQFFAIGFDPPPPDRNPPPPCNIVAEHSPTQREASHEKCIQMALLRHSAVPLYCDREGFESQLSTPPPPAHLF